jgi:protein gp37
VVGVGESTSIGWCDATFNPWWGCAEVSPGCASVCYAKTFANRLGMRDLWPEKGAAGVDRDHAFRFFGDARWAEPLKWARSMPAKLGRRPRVFCASMADVFEERDELDEHRDRLFDLIEATPELDWLVLTKRPEFAREYLRSWYAMRYAETDIDGGDTLIPLPNVWMGVSIENARFTWRADVLRGIPAAVRFISAEPLLGSLFEGERNREGQKDDRAYRSATPSTRQREQSGGTRAPLPALRSPLDLTGIDWVIVGGESGARARPFHLEHAREVIQAARIGLEPPYEFGLQPAIFVKQLGAKPHQLIGVKSTTDGCETVHQHAPLKLRDRKGEDWSEWPADLRIREFPRSAA